MSGTINARCVVTENRVKVCYPPMNSPSSGGVSYVGTVNFIPKAATDDGAGNILTMVDTKLSEVIDVGLGTNYGQYVLPNTSGASAGGWRIGTDGGQLIAYWGIASTGTITNITNGLQASGSNLAIISPATASGTAGELMFFDSGNNLGRSNVKTSDLQVLTVAGQGTDANYVLTTDGAGVASWQPVSGGGGTTTNPLTIGTGLSGTSFDGSAPVTIEIDSTVATLTGSQTLTNKTISGSSNTLSNIGNSSLTNSSLTINGTSISLGSSGTVTAAAGTLTGTTLASNVVTSSLTSIGTLSSGAVPASLVTAGTFGSGAYTIGTSLSTPSLIGVSGVMAFSSTAQSSGSITDFTFTPSNHTGQTASTNSPSVKIAASTKTLSAGTVTAFYGVSIESQTVDFASASTITNGYNLFVGSFPTGTNATVTNPYSIGTNGFIRIAAGSTTQGTIIRNDTTANYGAIYNGNVTPSNTNFAIKYNGTTTFVNGATGGSLFLTYNAGSVVNISSATAFGFADGVNISTGTTMGTKIGTATSQKISFFNKTPIIQPTTGITGATLVGGGGTTITSTDTFGGYTLAQLAAALINLGLIA